VLTLTKPIQVACSFTIKKQTHYNKTAGRYKHGFRCHYNLHHVNVDQIHFCSCQGFLYYKIKRTTTLFQTLPEMPFRHMRLDSLLPQRLKQQVLPKC
jgi:hypothetical protein